MKLTPHQLQTANTFMDATPVICHDPRGEFLNTLISQGFTPPKQLKIGELDRIDGPNDKPNQNSGWYVYHEMSDTTEEGYVVGIATFGDWKSDIVQKWASRSDRQMSDKERRNYREKLEVMRAQREEEERRKHNEAALKAYSLWHKLPEATNDHPYLKAKGVETCEGVKVSPDNDLIIPAMINGKIATLQYIKAHGEYEVNGNLIGNKKFMSGGKSKGVYFIIRGQSDVIYIAEGYSTGMSVHMATGKTVYVCFNCHNIYDATAFAKDQHSDAQIIIAGDDDFNNEINAGRKYAEEAARVHNALAIFPEGMNDFNDMYAEYGLEAVKKTLLSDGRARKHVVENGAKMKSEIERPAGVLGHIFDYYNATSGMVQHGFASQTAASIVGAMLSRSFKSNKENYSCIYTINVGDSGTGKEHIKRTAEKVLAACGFEDMICGDGFTSDGALLSVLLNKPNVWASIDEFGRYLEASASGRGGMQFEANTKIMEVYSKCDGVFRAKNYSSMTLTKEAKKDLKDRRVYNPCFSLMGMTTPSTLFKNLNVAAIEDGFATRFLIYVSDVKPKAYRIPDPIPVPSVITEWAEQIKIRTRGITHTAVEPSKPITLQITDEVDDMSLKFKQYEVDLIVALQKYGIQKLPNRLNENALRLSLIHALSRNPYATTIERQDFEWGSNHAKLCMDKTIDALKMTVSHSEFEGFKKEILADLRKREGGITWAQMQKTPPYSQHRARDLKDIMQSLRDAELVDFEAHNQAGRGRPTALWFATN